VLIRRSKTDQAGEGQEIAIPRGTHLRPVETLQAWLAAAAITEGPVFRPVLKGGRVRPGSLGDDALIRALKRRAAACKLDPADFAAHSLRSGFPTSAAEAEAEADVLKMAGRGSCDLESGFGSSFPTCSAIVCPRFSARQSRRAAAIVRAGPRQDRTCARAFSRTSPERWLAFPATSTNTEPRPPRWPRRGETAQPGMFTRTSPAKGRWTSAGIIRLVHKAHQAKHSPNTSLASDSSSRTIAGANAVHSWCGADPRDKRGLSNRGHRTMIPHVQPNDRA
jgi:hypothetical protein